MRHFAFSVLALFVFSSAAGAQQQTLDFENVFPGGLCQPCGGSGNAPVPPGFGGFTWTGFQWFNWLFTTPNWNAASHSGTQGVTAIVGEISRATPFDFLGAWFGSAYRDGLNLSMVGYRSNTAIFFSALTMNAAPVNGMTEAQLNWRRVDRIQFLASGGTLNPFVELVAGREIDAPDFTLDDFTFNPTATPEPATMVLLGTGLVGIGVLVRRRRRQRH